MPSDTVDRPSSAEESEIDPLADPEEAHVLYAALDSFRQYRHAAHYNITHVRRQSLYALTSHHLSILTSSPFNLDKTLHDVDEAIDANAEIAEAILHVGLASFGIEPDDDRWRNQATPHDLDKARSTIRQLYRDWSAEGLPERHAAFAPILHALESHLPRRSRDRRYEQKVLLPGAGLGRLAFEICIAGWSVEGNEISYHQILASNYILNHVTTANAHKMFPWALNFSNHRSRSQQLQAVSIPDVHPAAAAIAADTMFDVPFSDRMSMSSGDFSVVYREPGYEATFDAVATCFFIDTAPNVIRYVETVKHCLRSGGVWINVGPLLWHFESAPTPAEREKGRQKGSVSTEAQSSGHASNGIGEPGSFELTNDEVMELIKHFGFEILQQGESKPTGYIQDPTSMLQNVYRPAFWVARKL